MSSRREPMWYCHECNAEMRPLMVPDPVCASCHGSFVEKMENPTDDPREFSRIGPAMTGDEMPIGLEAFLYALQGATNPAPSSPRTRSTRTFEFRNGNTGRTIRVASDGTGEDPDQPTMADFLQRRPSEGMGGGINGSLMARYLMALLGGRDPLADMFAQGGDAQSGRMGDYVFNQAALDEIITQLMESSNNATRPVPATEDIIEKLPRQVLELGSPMLEKDCAICQEQFKLETEDPDEQIVVTLPCTAHHSFHEPCILPWLKSSGTCPVCRHALIPQPEHHGPPPPPNNGGSPSRRSPTTPTNPGGMLFQSLFGNVTGGSSSASGSRGGQSGSRNPRRRASSDRGPNNIPGGWEDDLD
ncbi:RING-type domain-containing protein [Mycena indigotica]|uniref:RING-type domain-containing protein n=1 Tax=Mycena indigotica TaxID=2126181 RepID=A0A8H6SZG4_9AGAR|nr:RING-type domain-containing protein [Mycena indigotica]KAF7307137.1 RING-type domain-containing protein [Mycena indigotica]